jgi:uncharacterized protein YjbI with pentapeptide repeats
MADGEHLRILKKGFAAWNEWRKENPLVRPNLSHAGLIGASLRGAKLIGADLSHASLIGADLIEANLIGADLSRAKLNGANLSGAYLSGANLFNANLIGASLFNADLSRADLSGASLSGTNLSGANLSNAGLSGASLSGAYLIGANLSRANLSGADLSSADLSGANLSGAYLIGADLIGANLTSASLFYTTFGNVDLRLTKGLNVVTHKGPSTIGLDSFFHSKGKIPAAFLRGAGAPDVFIEYAAALAGKPLELDSCFISYSTKDKEFVQRLHADLQGKGIRCWDAPDNLNIGDKFREKSDEAIRSYDKLLIVLSQHSVQSDWVEKQVETAFEKERQQKRSVLFPVRLDDAVMDAQAGWAADIRRTRHIGDFQNWKAHDLYSKAFERLLRDLKSEISKPDSGEG